MKAIRFVDFCADVLRLRLTSRQRVLALVAIDGVDPADLDLADRAIASELFGNVDEVPPAARRIHVWRLGRGSGKTTLAAALAVFLAVVKADLSRCGPGDEPSVVTIAPRLRTAHLAVRMARALMRTHRSLERLIVKGEDAKEGFAIQRPDGRRVRIAAYPASKGGAAARGISIVGFILDEAEFFASDSDFAVTDKEVYSALIPRLVPGAFGVLISTPWSVPTLMAELFDKNFGAPSTALAALGTTCAMRDFDPEIVAHVELERLRDPEMAAREFDCVDAGGGASGFFDPASVEAAVDEDLVLPSELRDGERGAAGMDLGLSKDSAALAIVARKAKLYRIAALRELRPTKGHALKLSEVIASFAEELESFTLKNVVADAWAREPAREWTSMHKISIVDAPAGNAAKTDTYLAARTLFREGRIAIPRHPRLLAMLKAVVSKPMEGGGLKISSPRRAGLAHSDAVSALVLGIWHAPDVDSNSWLKAARARPVAHAYRSFTGGGRGF